MFINIAAANATTVCCIDNAWYIGIYMYSMYPHILYDAVYHGRGLGTNTVPTKCKTEYYNNTSHNMYILYYYNIHIYNRTCHLNIASFTVYVNSVNYILHVPI
jgi:hypothetical protein